MLESEEPGAVAPGIAADASLSRFPDWSRMTAIASDQDTPP
jgi:hypothetical protein